MQNNIRKAFVAALLAVAAFGVSLAAPGGAAPGMPRPPWAQPDGVATATSVKTTTARLGSLRRDDTVVVAVEGVVADPGVDTNAVRAIVEEYCGTNVMPRVDAVESGLSDVEEWQRTNGLYSAVAELGDSVSAALATKADGTVVERGVYSPAMDTNDVWVVDVDGTVLRFSDADPAAGTVTWRGVCASNALWVSGSTTSAPPEVAYSLTTLETGAARVLASVDVVDAATGARCGIPRSAFGGAGDGVAYLAPGYDQAGPGDLQYSYTAAVRPLGSGALVFYRTDSGVLAEVMRFSRSRIVDAETSVVYDADLRRRLAELRAAVVSRDAATSGFTEWVVSAERPVTGEVVVAAFPAGSAPSGVCDWSLFYADDAVRDDSTRLADVKRASSAATNLVWAASETSWGISVTACRVRVPTVADIEGVQAVAGRHYDDANAMFAKLLHYATNNYTSAYLANKRAKNLEAWQYTNAVGRADVERGMTDWAMTPMWPIGYVDAAQLEDGADAGKWSLFPTGAAHTASNALLPAIDGAKNRFGDVVELLWPDASWRVEERWTNSLDKLGFRWTPDPGDGYVTAHFDARATRTRVVTMEDVYSLSTNMAQTVTGLVGGVSARLDRLGADLASAARLSLPGECFPVTYMAGSSPPVTIGDADGLSFREDGGVVRMGDAASGQYICSFDPGTLRFLESPYGDALLFGRGYSPGASNEWPVLSVAVRGAPVVPAGRTVNGKPLTNDVTLDASDVGVSSRLSEDGAVRYVRVGGDEFTVAPEASTVLTPAEYSDAPAFTEWEYSGLDGRFTVLRGPRYYPQYGGWYCDEVADAASGSSYEAYARSGDANATNLVMDFYDEWDTNFTFTATRVRTDVVGYALGSQTNKLLASTLAVDRLWGRSTNSFLKAEWETDGQVHRVDQNPYASIDWWWRWSGETNWFHAARFYPESIEYWDWDYLKLFAGENAGLWLGADDDGDNNITGGGYIGYRKGFVTLGGPGYYDEIYFPTGVGAGRDNNVFALTKDIAAAISPTSPAFSNAVLAVGLGIDTNTVAAINELVDSTHGLPLTGTASGGALLLALAAAIAALKRRKLDSLEAIAWSDLKAKRDGGNLVPGQQYRITDYVATTNGDMESRSANHPFDIIVTADDERTLNEHARAIMHETVLDFSTDTQYAVGDFCKFEGAVYKCVTAHQGEWSAGNFTEESPYFYNCDLAAWDVWYCLDNDTSRFAWALAEGATDSQTGTPGRGVVYRLVDEFGNDAPYDFKGIQFRRWAVVSARSNELDTASLDSLKQGLLKSWNNGLYYVWKPEDIVTHGVRLAVGVLDYRWYYTFGGTADLSHAGFVNTVYANKIAEYVSDNKHRLNNIVFLGSSCHSNTFGAHCYSSTFGPECYSNIFGASCYSSTFGTKCSNNTFGGSCSNNTFGRYCQSNTFGSGCSNNTFASHGQRNVFVRTCSGNTFGTNCYENTLGVGCQFNTFGSLCQYNTFGSDCYHNTFGRSCAYNTFGLYCTHITFGTSSSVKSYCRYVRVASGNCNLYINPTGTTSDGQPYRNVEIKEGVHNTTTNTYKTIDDPNVGQTFLTTYKPADSQEVSL